MCARILEFHASIMNNKPIVELSPFFILWHFVFVLRFFGPVNPMGPCCARSVYLTTLLQGRLSRLRRLTSIVHILSPETDNCPSWISGREKMTVENISWSVSTKEFCRPRRTSSLQPPDYQSNSHQTEPPRPTTDYKQNYLRNHLKHAPGNKQAVRRLNVGELFITKTRLFKYTENFTTKNWKIVR